MTSKAEKTYPEFVEDAFGFTNVDDFLDAYNALQLEYMRAFFEEYGEFLTEGNYDLRLAHFKCVPDMVAAATDLANLRADEYNTRAVIAQAKERIAETEDGVLLAGLEDSLKDIRDKKTKATEQLRAFVIEARTLSGQAKPLPGTEVKEMNVVRVYSWEKAEEWARHNGRFLLKLDQKEFERLVREFDVVPHHIAELETDLKVYISSNLKRYITTDKEEAE